MSNINDLVVANKSDLVAIADAIRTKAGVTDGLSFPQGFIDGIGDIVGDSDADFETQEKTVSPNETKQTITPDANYDGLSSVTVNAIPSTYVGSGVSKQGEKTVVPTKSSQLVVESGVYTTGDITVDAIPSEYIATSDATAKTSDIASGKTAYVNGEKVTGALPVASDYYNDVGMNTTYGVDNSYFILHEEAPSDVILKKNVAIELGVPMDIFGDASSSDVVKGKKFTSSNGVNIIGTHECSGGTGGIDTSDATAVAGDIAVGKTAYVNGEKITGNMVVQSYYISNTNPTIALGNDGDLCLVRGE